MDLFQISYERRQREVAEEGTFIATDQEMVKIVERE